MQGKITYIAMAALCVGGLFADDIYRNDFSTRTSAGTIPGERWMSYEYDPSTTLYYNYGYDTMAASMAASVAWNKNECQDGWAKAWIDDNYMQSPPGFAVGTDPEHGSSSNNFALFRSSTMRVGTAIQSFHNEFTNGMLRVEVDIRRPSVWGATYESTYAARVSLVYRKYMHPIWGMGVNSTEIPTMFGMSWGGGSSDNVLCFHYRKSDGSTSVFNPGYSSGYVCNDHWYRWRVYVNLDKGRCNYYIWDAGESQPDGRNTQDDSTATRKVEATQYFLRDPITEDTGGIAGICLNAYRFKSGSGDSLAVTNAPCYDNIHIAWKAPGSDEYVMFYENDFNTRRYRTIQPAATATAKYPVDAGVSTADTFSWYGVKNWDVGYANYTLLVNTEPGLVGMDNWIRLVKGNRVAVVDSKSAGGAVLAAYLNGNGVVAQTLGESITAGKVRISGDVRLPLTWAQVDSARACLALGSAAYWSGDPNSYTSRHIGYGGITGTATNEFRPAYLPKSGGLTATMSETCECAPTNWYRVVVTADIEAQTYDYDLYALGPDAGPIDRSDVPSEPVYSVSGIPFRNSISGIGAFSLFVHRPGDKWKYYILWDNIRVWKNWDSDAGTGTLIYSNDFDTRIRYVTQEHTPLVGGIFTGAGIDGWERVLQGSDDAAALITGGANRCLSLKNHGTYDLYLAQRLAEEVPLGVRVKFRVDVRPPCWWKDGGVGHLLNLYLGGDELAQCTDSSGIEDSVMMFSLSGKNGSLGRFTNTYFRVQSGTVIDEVPGSSLADPSHWYRMEGTTVSGSDTWSFRAYDMGTSHPEIDAEPGTVVASADGLARRGTGATSGMSSILISSGGVMGLEPWDVYDRGKVFVDNIVVSTVPAGTVVIVR